MTPLFCLSFGAMIFFSIALVSVVLSTRNSRAALVRIREIADQGREFRRSVPLVSVAGRRFSALVHWARARLGLGADATLPERLANAGYKDAFPADLYTASRIVLPVLGLIAACFIPFDRSFWIFALPGIAFIAPNMTLTHLVKRRRERIRKSIPDAVDLLVICVDSGLGLDQALLRVGQELGISHPEITEELLQINREQRAGKPRIQAWADMAARSHLDDIDAFVAMLMQTERFGTPIARALGVFADNLRIQRCQIAEEKAAKTTIKILFPLVLFIFPSLFLVLLGPAILNILRAMDGMAQ
jgi:tight adherence protein C